MTAGSDSPYGPPPSPGPSPYASPPPPPPSASTQLVRDPYTKLGGVASGIANHYGIDVSLVRILFVIFTFFTGFGLLIYLLAWLIVPRADFWPPVTGTTNMTSVSGRELGLGLAVVGVLVALFFSGGGFSQVLVPLLLISGGIWLLAQPPAAPSDGFSAGAAPGFSAFSSSAPPRPGPNPGPAPSPVPPVAPAAPVHPRAAGPDPVPEVPAPPLRADDPLGYDDLASPIPPPAWVSGAAPGNPVQPRKRRWPKVLLVMSLLLIPLIALIGLISVLAVVAGSGGSEVVIPRNVADLPTVLERDRGEIVLDLTRLEPEMFEQFDGAPVPVDIQMNVGAITVLVPEDIPVDVTAAADVGEVRLFDEQMSDGFEPSGNLRDDDPVVALDLELDVGAIEVVRG